MKHFDKQLLLEAAMAERGAFAALGPRNVAGYSYIPLGGDGVARDMDLRRRTWCNETWAGLHDLLAAYLREDTGFVARRAMQKVTRHGRLRPPRAIWRMGDWPTSRARASRLMRRDDASEKQVQAAAPTAVDMACPPTPVRARRGC